MAPPGIRDLRQSLRPAQWYGQGLAHYRPSVLCSGFTEVTLMFSAHILGGLQVAEWGCLSMEPSAEPVAKGLG